MKDLQTVLDALQAARDISPTVQYTAHYENALAIVKQMMQEEPVAWRSQLASGSYTYCNTPEYFDNAEPIYASPAPQAVLASKVDRLKVFDDAEAEMRRNPELSWRDAIADQFELAYGITNGKK